MKRVIILLLGISMFISSCNKLTVEVYLEGNVYDQDGMIALSGVEVAINVNGEERTSTTNDAGHFKFEKVPQGSYTLTFSRSGYGTVMQQMVVSVENGEEYAANMVATMYKFDQEMKTTVVNSLGGVYKPFANIPYKIYLGSNYLNNKIEGTTNEDGEITVENLPNSTITLVIDYEDEDYHYYRTVYEYPDNFNDLYTLYKTSLDGSFYLQATNVIDDEGEAVEDFIATSNIEFTFSTSINTENYDVALNKTYYKDEVAIDVSFENDDRKLVINPLGNSLDNGRQYNVGLSLESINGDYYYYNFSFYTQGAEVVDESLDQVTNIDLVYPYDVTNTTSYIEIEFDAVDNADYYEIYGMYNTSEYLLLETVYDYGYDVISEYIYLTDLQDIEVPDNGLFADGATYSIIIRATSNSLAPGPFSNPLVINSADY